MLIKPASGVILFFPLQHMRLNLRPVISLPSVSAVDVKLLLFAEATSEMVKWTASGSHTHTHTDELHEKKTSKNAEFRIKHENAADPLTCASSLGWVLAHDALIQPPKYANFQVCCQMWVNFPPLLCVSPEHARFTALNYCALKPRAHHR